IVAAQGERVLAAARTVAGLLGDDGAGGAAPKLLAAVDAGSGIPDLRLGVFRKVEERFETVAGEPKEIAPELGAELARAAVGAKDGAVVAPPGGGRDRILALVPAPGGFVVAADAAAEGSRDEARRLLLFLVGVLAAAVLLAIVVARAAGRRFEDP